MSVQKPTTMLMDEFKSKLTDLLNNAQLPAWVLLYLMEPFMNDLRNFDVATRERDREEYEAALKAEQKEEVQDDENSSSTCPVE